MPPALENPLVLWFVVSAALGGLAYAFLRKELRLRATFYGAVLAGCVILTSGTASRERSSSAST